MNVPENVPKLNSPGHIPTESVAEKKQAVESASPSVSEKKRAHKHKKKYVHRSNCREDINV